MIDVIRVMPLVTIAAVVIGIIFMIRRSGNCKGKLKMIALPLIAVLIEIASWLLNPGMTRLMLLVFTLFGFDIIVFFWGNVFAIPYKFEHRMLRTVNLLYNLTYILFWVLLPDGVEGGPTYCFFGLIQSEPISEIFYVTAFLIAFFNLFLFIWHTVLVIIRKLKREKSEEILNQINI